MVPKTKNTYHIGVEPVLCDNTILPDDIPVAMKGDRINPFENPQVRHIQRFGQELPIPDVSPLVVGGKDVETLACGRMSDGQLVYNFYLPDVVLSAGRGPDDLKPRFTGGMAVVSFLPTKATGTLLKSMIWFMEKGEDRDDVKFLGEDEEDEIGPEHVPELMNETHTSLLIRDLIEAQIDREADLDGPEHRHVLNTAHGSGRFNKKPYEELPARSVSPSEEKRLLMAQTYSLITGDVLTPSSDHSAAYNALSRILDLQDEPLLEPTIRDFQRMTFQDVPHSPEPSITSLLTSPPAASHLNAIELPPSYEDARRDGNKLESGEASDDELDDDDDDMDFDTDGWQEALPELFRFKLPSTLFYTAEDGTKPATRLTKPLPMARHVYHCTYPNTSDPPPPPVLQHTLLRTLMVYALRFCTDGVSDYDVDDFVAKRLGDHLEDNPDPDHFMRYLYPPGEWTGNPFLHPIERLRVFQLYQYAQPDHEDFRGDILAQVRSNTLKLLLNFRVDGPDHFTITRQRMAGFYGRPGSVGPLFAPLPDLEGPRYKPGGFADIQSDLAVPF